MRKVARGIFSTLRTRYGKVFLHVFTAGIIILLCTAMALQADDLQMAKNLFNEGMALLKENDFRGAAYNLEQLLTIIKKIGDRKAISSTTNLLGTIYTVLGYYPKALNYHEQALEIYTDIGDKKGEGMALGGIGLVSSRLGDNPKAIQYLEKSLQIASAIDNKREIGNNLYNLGVVYTNLGNYQKALRYCEQALKIDSEIDDKEGENNVLNHLGCIYSKLGDYPKALKYYEQALKIDNPFSAKFSECISLQGIGDVYNILNDYTKALQYYGQALKIGRSIGTKSLEGTTLNKIGDVYAFSSEYPTALRYYGQALDINREIGNKEGIGTTLNNYGVIYTNLGDFPKAIRYYEQSLMINKEMGDKKGIGNILNNLGGIYYLLGDYPKAIMHHEQALGIAREMVDKKVIGGALNNLGVIYMNQGNYQKALRCLDQALEIVRENNDKQEERRVIGNIGDIYLAQGDYKKALGFYEEINDPDRLGTVYCKLGDFQKALTYYEKSLKGELDIGRPYILIKDCLGMGEALEGLGRLEDAVSSYRKAVGIIEKLRAGLKEEKHKTGFLSTNIEPYQRLTSALARLYRKGVRLEDPDLFKYGNDYGHVSFYFAENTKARALTEILAGRIWTDTTYKLPKELGEKEQRLTHQFAKLYEQLEDAYKKDKELFKKKQEMIKSLEAELEQFVHDLRRTHPAYAALKYPQPLRLQDIPLVSNEIFLEYQVTEKATYLFVVGFGKFDKNAPQNSQKKLELLKLVEIPISREELKGKVKDFRRSFEDTRYINEFDPLKAKELYELLLAEGVKGLPPDAHLIIIPDGILNLLPFETLVVSTKKMKKVESKGEVGVTGYTGIVYAGDVWKMSYYQSATVLGINRKTGKKIHEWQSPLFALGDPIFDREDSRYAEFLGKAKKGVTLASAADELLMRVRSLAKERGYTFPRLEETRDEVVQIGEFLREKKQPYIRLDMDASESGVKDTNLTGCRYVHFATHGILGNEIPHILEPALVLNLVNNSDENGYLTMSEVMGLDMEVDMVTLSACNTGLGEDVGGEGVVGLTRAFMYAGSPSVLVSLWSVASESTTDFMVSVYRYLKEGKDKAEAVRLAKMDLRKRKYEVHIGRGMEVIEKGAAKTEKTVVVDASHPYFWGPFILVGEY